LRAHMGDFASAGQLYLDGCAFFGRFVNAILPQLNSIPSLVLGSQSESQLEFTYRGDTYRFRVRGGEDANGAPTAYVRSEIKVNPDEKIYKELQTLNIAFRVRANPPTWIFTTDGQQEIKNEAAFLHLMGAK
jgi:hypothetical protein